MSFFYLPDFKNVFMNIFKDIFSIIFLFSFPASLRFLSSIILNNKLPDKILNNMLSTWMMQVFGILKIDIILLQENIFRVEWRDVTCEKAKIWIAHIKFQIVQK